MLEMKCLMNQCQKFPQTTMHSCMMYAKRLVFFCVVFLRHHQVLYLSLSELHVNFISSVVPEFTVGLSRRMSLPLSIVAFKSLISFSLFAILY